MEKNDIVKLLNGRNFGKCSQSFAEEFVVSEVVKREIDMSLPLLKHKSSFLPWLQKHKTLKPDNAGKNKFILNGEIPLSVSDKCIYIGLNIVKELLPETCPLSLSGLIDRITCFALRKKKELAPLVAEALEIVRMDIMKENLAYKLGNDFFHIQVMNLLPKEVPVNIEACNALESEVFIGKYVPRYQRRFYKGSTLMSVRVERAAFNNERSSSTNGAQTQKILDLYAQWAANHV